MDFNTFVVEDGEDRRSGTSEQLGHETSLLPMRDLVDLVKIEGMCTEMICIGRRCMG